MTSDPVFAVYAFFPNFEDFLPVAIFTKEADAVAYKAERTPAGERLLSVVHRTMAEVVDGLVQSRLHQLGLKVDLAKITPQP